MRSPALIIFAAAANAMQSEFPPSGRTGSLGKDTYAMSHPFAFKDFMETHFPTAENMVQANSTQTCVEWVKLCIDDGHMTACSGPSGNFQMHAVGAYKRDSGSKSMEQLEIEYSKAFGTLAKYDPYMEYHMAFLTTGLDTYVSDFKQADIPYFPSTWTDPATQKKYSSILVRVPGSLASGADSIISIELLDSTSTAFVNDTNIHEHKLARASPSGLARAAAKLAAAPRKLASNGKPVIAPIHKSFASSNLTRDVAWFEGVLKGTKVYAGAGADGQVYSGVVQSADVTEVRYVQSSSKTQGPVSIAEWEAYQVDLHNKCFDTANNQGFDRLADNHVGHNMGGAELTAYINAQKATGLPYRFYTGKFLYAYAPNGWGIQLIGGGVPSCATCSDGYNMCTQGITGHCNKDGSA